MGSSLFNTSTLSAGSFGSNLIGSNPFANYNPGGVKKDGDEDSEGEEGEEEPKRPPSPEAFKTGTAENKEASPYTKLISVFSLNLLEIA